LHLSPFRRPWFFHRSRRNFQQRRKLKQIPRTLTKSVGFSLSQEHRPLARNVNSTRRLDFHHFRGGVLFKEEEEVRQPQFSTAARRHFDYDASMPSNVLGGNLQCCCMDPVTGFYRDGYCRTGPGDFGLHTVCAVMTSEFLEFSLSRGNDLSTPRAEMGFPGLQPGDRWCLCVSRWKEALDSGVAPPVILEATHASAVEFVSLEELMAHATDI
jgi:uncharacterized protein